MKDEDKDNRFHEHDTCISKTRKTHHAVANDHLDSGLAPFQDIHPKWLVPYPWEVFPITQSAKWFLPWNLPQFVSLPRGVFHLHFIQKKTIEVRSLLYARQKENACPHRNKCKLIFIYHFLPLLLRTSIFQGWPSPGSCQSKGQWQGWCIPVATIIIRSRHGRR